MKKKTFYLALALVITGAASVNGQVIIGGSETDDPHTGSILDLASGGQTNRGLLLPNVELKADASKFVLLPEATTDDGIKQSATGMLVYNTAGVPDGQGLYVWDGASWMPLGKNPCPPTVEDPEGNQYPVGNFGDAGCWMTENLRYIPSEGYIHSGTASDDEKHYGFPGVVTNGSPYSVVVGMKETWEANFQELGVLYNWAAAVNMGDEPGEYANPGDINQSEGQPNEGPEDYVRGICPSGWHLPSDREWNDLEEAIALSAEDVYSSTGPTTWPGANFRTATNYRGTHGRKMKSEENVPGQTTNTNGTSNAADAGGFNVLFAGDVRSNVGNFGTGAYFWTSSSNSMPPEKRAWIRYLIGGNEGVGRSGIYYRKYMFSVRCKKD